MLFSHERILETEASEAGEVVVGGAEDEAVFDGNGGEVRVWNEFVRKLVFADEAAEDFRMARRGRGRPDVFNRKPELYLFPRCFGRNIFQKVRVC